MASPGLSSTIILSEIILLETSLIIGGGIYLFLKAREKSKKLTDSLKLFTDNESRRLAALTNTLQKPAHLNDEKYNETLKNIITNENSLFMSMVNITYQKDLDLVDKVEEEITLITKPCAHLLSGDQQPAEEADEEEIVIDVDDAIDDLLADEDNNDKDKDPALDLSGESPPSTNGEVVDDDGIAEIPSELLDGGIADLSDEFEIEQEESPDSGKPTTNN